MKQVQISEELFQALVKYHLVGIEDYREEIEKGLESMTRRQFYSTYKTAATEGEREEARQKYLDKVGMHRDFQR